MNGFERRREQKKAAIIQAALHLFIKKGYKTTSVDEIAADASVSPVSIYNFFDTKANLYAKTLESYFCGAMEVFDEIVNSQKSFYEKLIGCIQYKISQREQLNPEFLSVEDLSIPQVGYIIAEFNQNRITPFFYKLIEQGKNEGAVDKTISADSIILYINLLYSGMTDPKIMAVLSNDEKLAKDMGKLFLFGFTGTSSKEFDSLFSRQ